MNSTEHRQRHVELHQALDELVADYLAHTNRLPSRATVLDLMQWSAREKESPSQDLGDHQFNRHGDVADAFNADDHVAEHGGEAPADLGPCCCCGESGPTVRNIIMLDKKAQIPGRGWGCVQCDLPGDGACVVICDRCHEEKRPYRFACRGYPAKDGRIPIEQLQGQHEHDMSKHPEAQENSHESN